MKIGNTATIVYILISIVRFYMVTVRAQHLTFLDLLHKRLFCFCLTDIELLRTRVDMVELVHAGIVHKPTKCTRLAPFLLLANPSSFAALFCFPVAVAAGWRRTDERSLQGFRSTVKCPPRVVTEYVPIRVRRPDDSPVRTSAGADLMLPRHPDIPAGLIALSVLLSTRRAVSSFFLEWV